MAKEQICDRKIKFLVHTLFQTSHTLVVLPVVQELVARGHEVLWLGSPAEETRIVESSGARFMPTQEVAKVDAELMSNPVFDVEGVAKAFFGARLVAQVADLRRAIAEFPADCLLNGFAPQGAAAMHDLGEIPVYATITGTPLYTSTGAATNPPSSAIGAVLCMPQLLLPLINPQRKSLGLPPLEESEMQWLHHSPFLHLQASCSMLEFNQEVAPTFEFVGPLVGAAVETDSEQPEWLHEVAEAKAKNKIVIGITQGTLVTDPAKLIIPVLEALAGSLDEADLGMDVVLIVASLHADKLHSILDTRGSRKGTQVRVTTWVDYEVLLPHCNLFITSGGYGGVMQALCHGVPVICAGTLADHGDVAARVKHARVGLTLETDAPNKDEVREAVRTVLSDSSYRVNAIWVGQQLKILGGATHAADLLVELVETRQKKN